MKPVTLKRANLNGAIAIFMLNILDVATTIWALCLGANELNPVSDFLINHGGILPSSILGLMIPLKFGIVSLILWGALRKDEPKPLQLSATWWVVGVYSLTVVLNALHVIWLL